LLRDWEERDLRPFAAVNADPQVMAFFPARLNRAESDALAQRIATALARDGFGFYAVEVKSTGDFVGFVGLFRPSFEAHFTPAVEIGWRLGRSAWGKGYATEAARACLAHGFSRLGFSEIVSFTAQGNQRSVAVMERLGMSHSPEDDFDHPALPDGSPLRRHLLYRLSAENWATSKAGG
jgi:RimJ/RimL family protein N-acetyltransferase